MNFSFDNLEIVYFTNDLVFKILNINALVNLKLKKSKN